MSTCPEKDIHSIYLDGELPASYVAEYEAHVNACPSCQATLERLRRIRRVFAKDAETMELTKEQMDEVKAEIALYKQYRSMMQHGRFYRGGFGPLGDQIMARDGRSVLSNPTGFGNLTIWTMTSEFGTKAVGMMLKKLVTPNTQSAVYHPKGLQEDAVYHFTNREAAYDIRDFGDLVNTVAPIHIRPDSLMHTIVAKKVKLPAEKEDYTAYGSLLCDAGVQLKQNYSGTGYNENVRYDQDFSAKLFVMEQVDE